MPQVTRPAFTLSLLHPRHWLAWLAMGMMWLIAHLPGKGPWKLGKALGTISNLIHNHRRRIAARNIALCFPELDPRQQHRLLTANMRNIGMMVIEFALGWMASDHRIANIPVEIKGLEHLQHAQKQEHGVLLVGGHFTHLELCARLVSRQIPIAGMYRQMDDAAFEWKVLRSRLNYADTMFDKDNLRGTVKYLRRGGIVWYAPDQDMRGKDNVFVPFFGEPASTITATHHLARLGKATVIPFFHHRRPDNSYLIELHSPLKAFPGPEVETDTGKVNQAIEAMVREAPDQYLWAHKRFKTRPPGKDPVY